MISILDLISAGGKGREGMIWWRPIDLQAAASVPFRVHPEP